MLEAGLARGHAQALVGGAYEELAVHASDDGRVLETAETCALVDEGLAVFSDTEGAVMCSPAKCDRSHSAASPRQK